MPFMILESREAIQAAIATMNPIARQAAELFANHILHDSDCLDDEDEVKQVLVQACAAACFRSGIDPTEHYESFRQFFANNVADVHNLGFSIAKFIVKEAEREKVQGRMGQVAAGVAGLILGSLFG